MIMTIGRPTFKFLIETVKQRFNRNPCVIMIGNRMDPEIIKVKRLFETSIPDNSNIDQYHLSIPSEKMDEMILDISILIESIIGISAARKIQYPLTLFVPTSNSNEKPSVVYGSYSIEELTCKLVSVMS